METKNPNTFGRTILATKKAIDSVYDFFSKIKNFHRELDIEGAASFYTQGIDNVILVSTTWLSEIGPRVWGMPW